MHILRCGGFVNNRIKKGLLLSLRAKKILKSVNIWQSYQQKRDRLMHFYRAMLCIRGTSHGPVSVCPSVRLSVCPSQVGVLLKRLNVGSRK